MTQSNTFSCQVNTTGENVLAYKLSFLSTSTGLVIDESEATTFSTPIKNKKIATFPSINNANFPGVANGNDYYWNVRLYNAAIGSTAQPNTLVCSGYLVGTTQYVVWTNNNDKIAYDMWIEFNTTGSSQMFPILEPNTENLQLPGSGEQFVERYQIDWVESDLGFNKNITKIETKDNFTYNYIAGTPFTLYRVSDQHTYTSVYVEPNDELEVARYIVLYDTKALATQAQQAGDTPSKVTVTPRETARKVVGYGQETGEVRVQEAFSQIPVNGNYYLLYEYDATTDTYTLVKSDVEQIVGGVAITDDSFVVITNQWDSTAKQLFIQPNINIKSDATNPNEIVFDDGTRVDIIQQFSTAIIEGETIEVTFEKLDNTQWLLKYLGTTSSSVPIIPGSGYKIYTDFMDSSPYCTFYARTTPTITMQFENPNSVNPVFENIQSETAVPYRDIAFQTLWSSPENVQTKYYQYFLYDETNTLFAQSEEIYDISLEWLFRGFQTSNYSTIPMNYSVSIKIVDEYNKEFLQSANFKIYYPTDESIIPMQVNFDCDKMAMEVIAVSPVYVESTDSGDIPTVDNDDLSTQGDYLIIPDGEVLNYTNVINEEKTPIILPSSFNFVTQFQITGDFISAIKENDQATVLQIAHKNTQGTIDVFTLVVGGLERFYLSNGVLVQNTNQLNFQIYKNQETTPLTCFNNGTQNYFNIMEEDPFGEIVSVTKIGFALQNSSEYIVISSIPPRPILNQKYILTQTVVDSKGVVYYQGVYIGNGFSLVPDYSTQFMFLENTANVQGATYSSLSVPDNCQGENGAINWSDEGNIWIDSLSQTEAINIAMFNQKWFVLQLIVNEQGTTEQVTCNISINNERV